MVKYRVSLTSFDVAVAINFDVKGALICLLTISTQCALKVVPQLFFKVAAKYNEY